MNLPTEIFGDVIVVHAPEELGEDRADEFESYITSLDRSKVILDIDNTETIDSAGLESLLSSQELLHELGGDLKISTSIHANRTILEVTRLNEQIEVFDSVIDAARSFV